MNTTVTIRMPEKLKKTMLKAAEIDERSLNAYIVRALRVMHETVSVPSVSAVPLSTKTVTRARRGV